MTNSLISGGWEHFCFFQVFFYFILRHLRHKALIHKPTILISYDKGNKFASFCVITCHIEIMIIFTHQLTNHEDICIQVLIQF
jgi:hypothetical protein